MSGNEEERPLLESRRESFVKFKGIDPHQDQQEANLQHAAQDMYDALVDDTIEDEDLDEDAVWLREQRHLNKTLHWLKRPSLFMIGFTIFLFSFAVITGESTRQILFFKLACNSLIRDSDKGYCEPTEAEVVLSNLKAATTVSTSIIALIAMTKVGQLSDQYGRKPFIFGIGLSLFVARVFQYYFMTHYDYLRFGWMIFLESLLSCTGGIMTFISLFNCYVSDIAEAHERSYFMGVGMAFFFTGISLGPISSNLVRSISKSLRSSPTPNRFTLAAQNVFNAIENYEWDPLRFEMGVLVVLMAFIVFVLPESRPEKSRQKSRTLSMSRLNEPRPQRDTSLPFADQLKNLPRVFGLWILSFFKPLALLIIPKEFKPANISNARFQKERMAVLGLVLLDSMLTAFGSGMGEVYVLYGILKFHWTSTEIGYFLAIGCAARAIVLVVISPLLNHYVFHRLLKFRIMKTQFDMPDFVNVLISFVAETIGMAMFPFVQNTGQFFVVLTFTSLGSLSSPSINSAIVKYYPDAKTGELFSGLSVVKNLSVLTVPVLLLTLYNISLTKIHYPGLVFLVISGAFFVMALVTIAIKLILGLHSKSEQVVLTRSNSFSKSFIGQESPGASPGSSPGLNINTPGYFETHSNANGESVDPLARADSFGSTGGKSRPTISELHRKNSNISQYRAKP